MLDRNCATSRTVAALLALTFAFPIVLVLVFFPTPAVDLREQINWGLHFPLYTWKLPPLQSWLVGLVALTSIRDAWVYVLAAQVLNFIALFYLVRTAREFIGEHAVVPIAIGFCGSLYSSLAVVDSALNADQIQAWLWLGLLYHVLRASRDNRRTDWLACAAFTTLALLAKYFALVFIVALALGLIATRSHRAILHRPGLYASAALALALFLVHFIPSFTHSAAVDYATNQLFYDRSISRRLLSFLYVLGMVVRYGAPLLVALGVLAWGRQLRAPGVPADGAPRVIVLTAAILYVVMLALALIGARFRLRYGAPMFPIALLAFFCLVRIEPESMQRFAGVTLASLAAIVAGTFVWATTYVETYLRDPAPEAAAAIRSDWDRRFACGPAYVLGSDPGHSPHAIGIYFGRSAVGLSRSDFDRAHWVDRDRLQKLGAVIVDDSEAAIASAFAEDFAQRTAVTTVSPPYRRTWIDRKRTYFYRFVAPQGC